MEWYVFPKKMLVVWENVYATKWKVLYLWYQCRYLLALGLALVSRSAINLSQFHERSFNLQENSERGTFHFLNFYLYYFQMVIDQFKRTEPSINQFPSCTAFQIFSALLKKKIFSLKLPQFGKREGKQIQQQQRLNAKKVWELEREKDGRKEACFANQQNSWPALPFLRSWRSS